MNLSLVKKIVFISEGGISSASSRIYGYDLNSYLKKNYNSEFVIYNLAPTSNISWRNKIIIFRVLFKIIDYLFYIILITYLSFYLKNKIIILHVGPAISDTLVKRFLKHNILIYHMIDNQLMNSSSVIENNLEFKGIFYKFYNSFYNLFKNKHKRIENICKQCNAIIVNNEFNLSNCVALNPNTFIFTDPINIDRYTEKKNFNNDFVTVGWIGQPSNTNYLLVILEAIRKLTKKYKNKIKFSLIGGSQEFNKYFDAEIIKWDLNSENKELEKFDIGIMPLPNDEFTLGKGGYKILQYMAKGIPIVASPVGINNSLVQEGRNGFLPNNNNEWVSYISKLVDDGDLRREMGYNSRKSSKKYSYDEFCKNFLDILSKVEKHEK